MKQNPNLISKDKQFALLYGIMLGDGCLSLVNKNKFLSITGSSKEDLSFFENVISPILKDFRGKETKIKFRKDCNAIEYNFTDKNLFDLFYTHGFPYGKKGPSIMIPIIFYEKDLIKYIIQGFFATDGSIVLTRNPNKFYPRLELHAISKDLVRQVYDYLISLGFKGHFYKCKRKVRDLRWKVVQDQYRFQFNGIENLVLFNELIGFVNPKHEKKFLGFLEYSNEYDKSVNGVAPKNQKLIRDKLNIHLIEKMAVPGVELGAPSL